MAQEVKAAQAAKKAKKGGFMAWYESYNGKKVTGIVYSLGASVVIIGALFKILHWPGANYTLMAGMFTEAFLFAIGCLDKPHLDFHWDEVFPQVADHNSDPERLKYLATLERPNLAASAGNGAALPAAELEGLKGSLNNLTKTAEQLADLSKVAAATSKLGEKAEEAAKAAEQYAAVANELGKNSANLNASVVSVAKNVAGAAEGSKEFSDAMAAAGKNSGTLGADVQKLSKTIADLNAIYGNMLNAVA